MGVLERSQLSASALLIVRATLWLLPGFISRHFIEGGVGRGSKAGHSHCRDSYPGTSLREMEDELCHFGVKIAGIHIPALH